LQKRSTDGLKEFDIQKAVFKHFAARAAPGVIAFHPKNASFDHRTHLRAGVAVALGVLPGIPDIVITRIEIGHMNVFGLELKREERCGKKPTEHEEKQRKCREMLEDSGGWITHCAYGLNEALDWLERQGLLLGNAR
jgi:hypothetical protein